MSDKDFYKLKIERIEAETEQAVCVSFLVPDDLATKFAFKQGQYLTLRAIVDGEEVRRSYSICSGVFDGSLRVAIKRVKSGVFSNYANDCFKSGDEVDVMPPRGQFYIELDSSQARNYMCLAVGSGITPMLSIIKTTLEAEPQSQMTLIYGNHSSNSMMFKEELSFIKNEYLNRFQWINLMTEEDQGSDLLFGRLDNKKGYLLQKYQLIDIKNTDHTFICGPESMMSEVSRGFRLEGLKDSNIHYELFASSLEDSKERLAKAKHRVEEYGENSASKVTVRADGRAISFDLAAVGENILDAGIKHGMDLPHSCKAGVCSTCKAKLINGKVDMDISHGLQAGEIEQGYILTCQAHPITEQVEVDFDER